MPGFCFIYLLNKWSKIYRTFCWLKVHRRQSCWICIFIDFKKFIVFSNIFAPQPTNSIIRRNAFRWITWLYFVEYHMDSTFMSFHRQTHEFLGIGTISNLACRIKVICHRTGIVARNSRLHLKNNGQNMIRIWWNMI